MSRRIALVGGGTRSGKSASAVSLGITRGDRRVFVATARTSSDPEMQARIARHRAERRDAFQTIEEPLALATTLAGLTGVDVVVVDCVTHWLSNLLIEGRTPESILSEVDEVVRVIEERRFDSVLVTSEVGMSVHPETALGRAFVEVCGWANQRLARAADEVFLAILGTVVTIRSPGVQGISAPCQGNFGAGSPVAQR